MKKNIKIPLLMLGAIWFVYLIDFIIPIHLTNFGIHPRSIIGLPGILFSPFLHGGLRHIISNSLPLLILSFTISYFYKEIWLKSTLFIILIGGGAVWLFAVNSNSNHIGASGLIFGYVTFLIGSGIFRKNFRAFLVAIVIFFVYGGVLWGVLPTQQGISWEGHLFGAITGIVAAWIFRKN